ncbi:hypothetical protein L3i20_v219900 [Paenibacillus sp. L3-i20]|nr:hypothetical protein L3i20_v219900 [Paenibacillus sp. L3-i20]
MERPKWSYHYGYSRSTEARESEDIGQDFLTFFEEKDYVSFAICDGISMSYYGDFASSFLGESLLQWLLTIDEAEVETEALSAHLHTYLLDKAKEADERLKDHQIPTYIKGMLRDVLLSKKKLGSGSIYGCGRIDWPCEAYPEGRIVLAWQGDIRIRLWSEGHERKGLFGNRFHTREQWNSVSGPVGGSPHTYVGDLLGLGSEGGLLLYSDGLQALDSMEQVLPEEMSSTIRSESLNLSSDDMSIFQVQWHL